MYGDDSIQTQLAIDVRKQLGPSLEVLVDDRAGQPRTIDLEQHQIRSSSKEPVGNGANLVDIRAVNEPFRLEGFWRIGT